jgi:hypothetical protein
MGPGGEEGWGRGSHLHGRVELEHVGEDGVTDEAQKVQELKVQRQADAGAPLVVLKQLRDDDNQRAALAMGTHSTRGEGRASYKRKTHTRTHKSTHTCG